MKISFAQFLICVKKRNKTDRLTLECALFTLRKARDLHPMARQHMFATLKEIIESRNSGTH